MCPHSACSPYKQTPSDAPDGEKSRINVKAKVATDSVVGDLNMMNHLKQWSNILTQKSRGLEHFLLLIA